MDRSSLSRFRDYKAFIVVLRLCINYIKDRNMPHSPGKPALSPRNRIKSICQKLHLRLFPPTRKEATEVEITIQCYDRRPDNIPMFVTSWDVARSPESELRVTFVQRRWLILEFACQYRTRLSKSSSMMHRKRWRIHRMYFSGPNNVEAMPRCTIFKALLLFYSLFQQLHLTSS
jgi:hypothetical protein